MAKPAIPLLVQWPALYAYFDRQIEVEPTSDRVQIIATLLSDPQVKIDSHFVSYAKFSTAFQTHAGRIDTLQSDVCKLLRAYMSNFIDPDILKSAAVVSIQDRGNQVKDDKR